MTTQYQMVLAKVTGFDHKFTISNVYDSVLPQLHSKYPTTSIKHLKSAIRDKVNKIVNNGLLTRSRRNEYINQPHQESEENTVESMSDPVIESEDESENQSETIEEVDVKQVKACHYRYENTLYVRINNFLHNIREHIIDKYPSFIIYKYGLSDMIVSL